MKITAEFALKTAQGQNIQKNSKEQSHGSKPSTPDPPNSPNWIKKEVGRGLLFLVGCRLPFSPRAEQIQELTEAWSLVFEDEIGVPIKEIDAPRIQKGFKKAGRLETWPAPGQVLALMPPRPTRRALDHLPEPNPERDLAAIRNIQKMLSGGKK